MGPKDLERNEESQITRWQIRCKKKEICPQLDWQSLKTWIGGDQIKKDTKLHKALVKSILTIVAHGLSHEQKLN